MKRFHLSKAVVPLVTMILAANGCRSVRGGAFEENAYYPARDHYRVRRAAAAETSASGLLPRQWLLDNFQVDGSGRVGAAKWGEDYRTTYELDADNDGRAEHQVAGELYDLRFVHARDGSVVWSRTLPLPSIAAERSLDVIAHDYVDRVGGGNYFTVHLSGEIEQRRLGTRLVEEGPVRVGGVAGWMVTFDVLALDQREANPEYVGHRVTLVLVRPTGLSWDPAGLPSTAGDWPMLVVFGLAGRAELQPDHMGDFTSLLSRVDLRVRPDT